MLQLTHAQLYDDVLAGTRGGKGHTNRARAVLFEGPPGCGKTSMARMMASTAGVVIYIYILCMYVYIYIYMYIYVYIIYISDTHTHTHTHTHIIGE